jgi:hypothetical protein
MIRHTTRLLVGIGLFLGQPLPAAVPPAAATPETALDGLTDPASAGTLMRGVHA